MKQTKQSPFKTMADVRAKNIETGRHFFDRDTMKWWKSRIETKLIEGRSEDEFTLRVETKLIAGRYFITSEDEFDGREPSRIYAIRYANDDGSMKTLKSRIRSLDGAKDELESIRRAEKLTAKS